LELICEAWEARRGEVAVKRAIAPVSAPLKPSPPVRAPEPPPVDKQVSPDLMQKLGVIKGSEFSGGFPKKSWKGG